MANASRLDPEYAAMVERIKLDVFKRLREDINCFLVGMVAGAILVACITALAGISFYKSCINTGKFKLTSESHIECKFIKETR